MKQKTNTAPVKTSPYNGTHSRIWGRSHAEIFEWQVRCFVVTCCLRVFGLDAFFECGVGQPGYWKCANTLRVWNKQKDTAAFIETSRPDFPRNMRRRDYADV